MHTTNIMKMVSLLLKTKQFGIKWMKDYMIYELRMSI